MSILLWTHDVDQFRDSDPRYHEDNGCDCDEEKDQNVTSVVEVPYKLVIVIKVLNCIRHKKAAQKGARHQPDDEQPPIDFLQSILAKQDTVVYECGDLGEEGVLLYGYYHADRVVEKDYASKPHCRGIAAVYLDLIRSELCKIEDRTETERNELDKECPLVEGKFGSPQELTDKVDQHYEKKESVESGIVICHCRYLILKVSIRFCCIEILPDEILKGTIW